jgi:hypothetical protein
LPQQSAIAEVPVCMARVFIDGSSLHIELSTLDKVFSVHGSFSIPLVHVGGASTQKPPGFWESLKVIGTNWPWGLMAGSYLYHGGAAFFDFHGNEAAVLVVDLVSEHYKHLYIHVDEPDTAQAAAARITAALPVRS